MVYIVSWLKVETETRVDMEFTLQLLHWQSVYSMYPVSWKREYFFSIWASYLYTENPDKLGVVHSYKLAFCLVYYSQNEVVGFCVC